MPISNVVKTILLNEAGEVLLLRRSRTDEIRPGDWDLPGGGVEDGEEAVTAAVREIREETNIILEATLLRLVYAMTHTSADGKSSVNRFVYAGKAPVGQSVIVSFEHEEYQWMSIDEVLHVWSHPVYTAAIQYAIRHDLLTL